MLLINLFVGNSQACDCLFNDDDSSVSGGMMFSGT